MIFHQFCRKNVSTFTTNVEFIYFLAQNIRSRCARRSTEAFKKIQLPLKVIVIFSQKDVEW